MEDILTDLGLYNYVTGTATFPPLTTGSCMTTTTAPKAEDIKPH